MLRILESVFHIEIELIVFEVRQAADETLERRRLHDLAARVVLRGAITDVRPVGDDKGRNPAGRALVVDDLKQSARAVKHGFRVHAFDANAIGPGSQSIGLAGGRGRAVDGGRERQRNFEPLLGFKVGKAGGKVFGEHVRFVFQNRVLDRDVEHRTQLTIPCGGLDRFRLGKEFQIRFCRSVYGRAGEQEQQSKRFFQCLCHVI